MKVNHWFPLMLAPLKVHLRGAIGHTAMFIQTESTPNPPP
jgi:hypothetical protein